MARFGFKTRVCGLAKPMISPVCDRAIVARFGCEGKPDNGWKSRIFNNLSLAWRVVPDLLCGSIGGPTPRPWLTHRPIIVVLVE
jgi:hypothetical protein